MLTDVGVFTEVSEKLETEKDVLIPVRTFRMSLMLNSLSMSSPGGTEPGRDLGVVEMSREVEGTSRDSRDRYYCRQVGGGGPWGDVWLTRSGSRLEICGSCGGGSTFDSAWGTRRGTHGEIIVRLEGNNAILYSNFVKAVGGTVVDNYVSVGIDFERYSGSGRRRGIGNDADSTSCMW